MAKRRPWRSFARWALAAPIGLAACVTIGAYFFLPWPDLRRYSGPPPVFAFDADSGTGFFIDDDGYLMTNRHVVRDCRRITVAGPGVQTSVAQVVSVPSDGLVDLALVRTDAHVPATLAFSDEPWPSRQAQEAEVTTQEVANALHTAELHGDGRTEMIGYPGSDRGLIPETTPVRLDIATTTDYRHWWRRFDGPMMQGSSGSPLLNERGEIIGIAAAVTADLDPMTHALRPGDLERTLYGTRGKHGTMIPAAVAVAFARSAGRKPTVASSHDPRPLQALVRVFCFHSLPSIE